MGKNIFSLMVSINFHRWNDNLTRLMVGFCAYIEMLRTCYVVYKIEQRSYKVFKTFPQSNVAWIEISESFNPSLIAVHDPEIRKVAYKIIKNLNAMLRLQNGGHHIEKVSSSLDG